MAEMREASLEMDKDEKEITLADILAQAVPSESGEYANHAQIWATQNEIVIDFYLVEPMMGQVTPSARHIKRIYLPLTQGKGFVSAIANTIAAYEEMSGIHLPVQRKPDESDRVKIWE